MRWMSLVVVGVALSSMGCAAKQKSAAQPVLPLTTVRLYETGVGYFERAGTLEGGTDTLPVPASHVDDALKTLIVMTNGGKAQVSAVEFDSVMSRGLARSLAALPLESDSPVTYEDVLNSLKGVELEVVSANKSVRGKLVEVTKAPPVPIDVLEETSKTADSKPAEPRYLPDTENDHYLTLLSEDGTLRRFRASQVASVRPTDPILAARLGSAAGALSGRAAQIQRGLRVLATEAVPVRLGYIAETPVWRSTYRLVLEPESRNAKIQGWALIHNDTDERWKNVQVELVNGRPDSFLFPLSAPRYSRRPLAEPPEKLSTVPQLADQTPDQIWGDNIETSGGTGTGYGYGSGHGRLGGSHRTRAPKVRMGMASVTGGESDEISIGNLADVAQSTGVEAGALFSYRLANKLQLRPHGSALVPFTSQAVEARRLTWFDDAGSAGSGNSYGRSGVRLTNTSGQTLPAGPVSIYERSGFSGETGIPRLKPKERAFMNFGVDLDVELEFDPEFRSKPVEDLKKVRFENGVMIEHYVRRSEAAYVVTNRSGAPRDVYLVLNIVKNSKVQGADELDFDLESDKPLAVFAAKAKSKSERKVVIEQALQRNTPLYNLDVDGMKELAKKPELSEPERKILGEAVVLLDLVEKANTALGDANKEVERIQGDLERMREHLKALGDKSGSPAGANPIVTRILELEDRLSKQRRTVESLEETLEQKRDDVKKKLETLGEDTPAASPAPAAQPVPKP
ncbi:MAG: hypothetical protein H6716_03555 [Polyangiaceae bacterium]|nr:hypothetical protein [Polyangiaceae bacterium]